MILHASISADNPKLTAQALAQLMGGQAAEFGPGPGAWTAFGPDPVGSMIEVVHRGSEFHCMPDAHVQVQQGQPHRHSGFHLLVESPHDEEQVMAIARAHHAKAHRASNGFLDLIEVWFDDCSLIEIATPEISRVYRALLEPERLEKIRREIASRRPRIS